MIHRFSALYSAAPALALIVACGATGNQNVDFEEKTGVVSEALQCGYYVCGRGSDPTDACSSWGAWPGGNIYYQWGNTTEQGAIRQAMDDWERMTGNVVRFLPAMAGNSPVETINGPNCNNGACGGEGTPYTSCNGTCNSGISASNAYHELGHIIGLRHEFDRNDRTHYWWSYNNTDEFKKFGWLQCADTRCSIPSAQNTVDYGPFDFRSTMMYLVTHPDQVRWDGSPIVPGASCGNTGTAPGVPGCPGSNFCPTCASCAQAQPGFPTKNDVSAVLEMYNTARVPSWAKFRRTVEEDTGAGAQVPFNYGLSGSVTIPRTSSPAVETWGGDSLGVYARGSDDAIWKKYLDTSTYKWSSWSSLGRPSGSGTLSDPAVVSWANGRSDLVVRQGTSVYIMSTPTWGSWQSLGSPDPGAASGPAIASWGPNHLDVFVRAADNGIYHKWCGANCSGNSGSWSGWDRIGNGTFRGKPSVIARPNNRIDVYGHGMDEKLWAAFFDGSSWGSWNPTHPLRLLTWDASCPDCSSPAAGANPDGSGAVYVLDQDGLLQGIGFDPNHAQWASYRLGGALASSPGTISKWRDGARADIVATIGEESTAGTMNYGIWWKKLNP